MRRAWVVCRHALGQLLAGRRLLVTALLSAIPLLAPALLFAARGDTDPVDFSLGLFRNLVLPFLLPVVSLAFATAALGSEVRDGTATNLLLKPITRVRPPMRTKSWTASPPSIFIPAPSSRAGGRGPSCRTRRP